MRALDLSGKRFGRLAVIRRVENFKNYVRWECLCDCGNTKIAYANSLSMGKTVSCGCLGKEVWRAGCKQRFSTHRLSKTREYSIWAGMKARCHQPNDAYYARYGGRGIYVCEEWRDSFDTFLKDMGPRPTPKHTIDRIDNDGPYSPGNCRWATYTQQIRNRRVTKRYQFQGAAYTLKELSEFSVVGESALWHRIKKGWHIEDAVTLPPKPGFVPPYLPQYRSIEHRLDVV